jgi:hypothetical protein
VQAVQNGNTQEGHSQERNGAAVHVVPGIPGDDEHASGNNNAEYFRYGVEKQIVIRTQYLQSGQDQEGQADILSGFYPFGLGKAVRGMTVLGHEGAHPFDVLVLVDVSSFLSKNRRYLYYIQFSGEYSSWQGSLAGIRL